MKIENDTYEYIHDSLYNITKTYLNNNLINSYTYDSLNQLIEEKDYIHNKQYIYVYDKEGNIKIKKEINLETQELIKTDTYEYNNPNWEDQLTKFNNELITYDGIGNPLTIGNKTLTWKNGRQLSTYTDNNLNITYDYDINGIRKTKTINGIKTEYLVANNNILIEKRNNDMIYYIYDANEIIGLKHNNNIYYYKKNYQGDIIGIYNSNYNQVVSYEYDSWGKVLHVKDSLGNEIIDTSNIGLINPYRYRSYYYDEETKLYYLNSRYYNPEWCRFINADSIIDSGNRTFSNLFSYCNNNPVNNVDKIGKLGLGIIIIGTVLFIGGCSHKSSHKIKTDKKNKPKKDNKPVEVTPKDPKKESIPSYEEKVYASTVYAEAGGENYTSKEAVAHVMYNRIGINSWDNIIDVVSAPYQFDGYDNGMYNDAMNYYNTGYVENPIAQSAMNDCLEIVVSIYENNSPDITNGAIYFHSFENPSDWAYHEYYTQVYVDGTNNFWFYK